jgi:hypothetical protein
MTPNEIDTAVILEWLTSRFTPPEKISAAQRRLVDQLPKPAEVVDMRPDGERRAEILERNKGPKGGNGLVLPPPGPEEVARLASERKALAERAKRMKRPTFPQRQVM